LCKLQTRGRAEGSTVRGDRQKPVGPVEFSPRVPSTESRKRSGFFWTVGQRSTAGKGRSFGMAGGGGVSPPLPDPGESERSAPGGELFPERRVSERSAPGGEVFPERRVSEHPCSRPFNLLKRWISRAFLGKVGARCSRRAWLPAFQSLERVALRAGEGEMLWACGPSDLPFQPLGAPRWLSYLLGPRSGPVDFQGKSTRATSRSASATTTFLRAWHVLEGGLQAVLFPGEKLRSTGTLSGTFSRKRPGSDAEDCLFGRREK